MSSQAQGETRMPSSGGDGEKRPFAPKDPAWGWLAICLDQLGGRKGQKVTNKTHTSTYKSVEASRSTMKIIELLCVADTSLCLRI